MLGLIFRSVKEIGYHWPSRLQKAKRDEMWVDVPRLWKNVGGVLCACLGEKVIELDVLTPMCEVLAPRVLSRCRQAVFFFFFFLRKVLPPPLGGLHVWPK